jgi:hypothetical protein
LGYFKYFLDIKIACSHKGPFISQWKYAFDLLKETRNLGSKPANVPMDYNQKVTYDTEPLEDIGVL